MTLFARGGHTTAASWAIHKRLGLRYFPQTGKCRCLTCIRSQRHLLWSSRLVFVRQRRRRPSLQPRRLPRSRPKLLPLLQPRKRRRWKAPQCPRRFQRQHRRHRPITQERLHLNWDIPTSCTQAGMKPSRSMIVSARMRAPIAI
jgi:hypothetical protein